MDNIERELHLIQDAQCVLQDMFSEELHIPMEINPMSDFHSMNTCSTINNTRSNSTKVRLHTKCIDFSVLYLWDAYLY